MDYASQTDFLRVAREVLAKGPVAVILVEDLVEVESTLRHHLKLGFRTLILCAPEALRLPADLAAQVHRIPWIAAHPEAFLDALNPLIAAAPTGTWFYYGFNAEYLFYPFCETRTVREMLAFHTEERRFGMLSYVIDLYAADLGKNPDGVNLAEAMLDRTGYYALSRPDPGNPGRPRERQLDFFGGLRWRFDEHIPPGAAQDRPDRAVSHRPGSGTAGRSHALGRGEEHLCLSLAPQSDGSDRVFPGGQGAQAQSGLDL